MSLDIYARQVFAHIPRWVSIILAFCRYIFHFHRLIFVLYLALCLLIWLNSTVASVSSASPVAWHTERFHMGEVSGIILGKFLGNCRSHNKTKMFSNPVDKLLRAFRHAIDSWAWLTSSIPPSLNPPYHCLSNCATLVSDMHSISPWLLTHKVTLFVRLIRYSWVPLLVLDESINWLSVCLSV